MAHSVGRIALAALVPTKPLVSISTTRIIPLFIGHFTNTVDFDPGTGTFNMTGGGATSFILKLTDLGAFEWAKETGGNSPKCSLIQQTRVTLAGSFQNRIDVDPGSR
ncbi:MAG: hypothetical protein WDO15_23685 [Bacteroidota bacterium]